MAIKIKERIKSINLKAQLKETDFKSLFFAIFGSALIALGTRFLAGAEIPEGGIVGVCLMIEHLTGISTAITSLIINALLYLLSWRLLGSGFIFNATIATVGFSAFYALFDVCVPDIQFFIQYPLLGALVGAVIIETGTGLTIRFGGAPSGDHAVSVALAKKGNIDLGWLNFIRDFIVIALSYTYVDNPYTVVYSILIMTITTPIMDYVAKMPNTSHHSKKTSKKSWGAIIITGIVLSLLIAGITVYIQDYYHADATSIKTYSSESAERVVLKDGVVAYVPNEDTDVGLILYPGGKVEYTSYEPLLIECAERGIACVVVEMPYNLAVFGINAALDIPELLPEIEKWYIGGHSLGGSMAANCAANNPDVFEGVILLAAYSTSDISNLRVLSVYGNYDKVLNMNKYNKYKDNLPNKYDEHVILGGCHAYFGVYGAQEGDGIPTISNREQIEITADHIADFIFE